MRYTFDVTNHENESVIKVEIGFGSISNSVSRTITFINDNLLGEKNDPQDLNELISDMVDNIRLTVKEREDAMKNIEIFRNYVTKMPKPKQQQLIVENGDPSVLGDPDKYIK